MHRDEQGGTLPEAGSLREGVSLGASIGPVRPICPTGPVRPIAWIPRQPLATDPGSTQSQAASGKQAPSSMLETRTARCGPLVACVGFDRWGLVLGIWGFPRFGGRCTIGAESEVVRRPGGGGEAGCRSLAARLEPRPPVDGILKWALDWPRSCLRRRRNAAFQAASGCQQDAGVTGWVYAAPGCQQDAGVTGWVYAASGCQQDAGVTGWVYAASGCQQDAGVTGWA